LPEVLALPLLYDAVQARFVAESSVVSLAFGWDAPATQHRGARIVMVPGDESGQLGSVGPARHPGQLVRPLASIDENFHVIVSAADLTDPESDRAQYTAARLLLDAWIRAAVLYAGPRLRHVGGSWLVDRTTRSYGASILTTWTIDALVPDEAFPGSALAGLLDADYLRGIMDVTKLGVVQQIETKPAPIAAVAVARAQITLSGAQIMDGVTPAAGSVVLVTAQTLPAQNGLYTRAAGAWARTATVLVHDLLVTASTGASAPSLYRLATADPITPDVTAQSWTRVTPEAP